MDQLWNLRCHRWTEHLKVWKLPSLKVICGKLTKIYDHIAPQSGEIFIKKFESSNFRLYVLRAEIIWEVNIVIMLL